VGEEDADRVSEFAMRWNVLQCCGVWQRVSACCIQEGREENIGRTSEVAVCCRALPCVAVCCSVLQCVAVCSVCCIQEMSRKDVDRVSE